MNETIQNQIVLYQTNDGQTEIKVDMHGETVWLSQSQMSDLFEKDQSVIARHIGNIFKEGELEDKSNMQILHNTISKYRPTKVYSLDVIISVGYRVKSIRGTQFRIWANKILKDYLIKGYAIRDTLKLKQYEDLKQVLKIMKRTLETRPSLESTESRGLLEVVSDYTYALDTLDDYDNQRLSGRGSTKVGIFHATYELAIQAIEQLKEKFGGSVLFALEKDESFHSSIGQIYQTFDSKELYETVEEKAAMFLYLIVKNHSFVDGNKRIGATLFLWFMENNGVLYYKTGTKRIADETLVALTLLVAESKSEEKDIIVNVIINLITNNRDI
ncbi:MAG: Fic/DOC family protein [Spirochaetia bacterium]|nr:Fic/DOC family protein [Spirochaetia bacterium]